jgi:hypothetical protein
MRRTLIGRSNEEPQPLRNTSAFLVSVRSSPEEEREEQDMRFGTRMAEDFSDPGDTPHASITFKITDAGNVSVSIDGMPHFCTNDYPLAGEAGWKKPLSIGLYKAANNRTFMTIEKDKYLVPPFPKKKINKIR